jgi:PIN domain nuclease of toxin-antitoxin system
VIVLDTHALIWLVNAPTKIGKKASRKLATQTRLGIAAVSLWEVAMLVVASRLRLDRPTAAWIEAVLTDDARLEVVPISPAIATDAAELSWKHRDPADRLIVATARVLNAPLVTADEEIRDCGLVRCVWD